MYVSTLVQKVKPSSISYCKCSGLQGMFLICGGFFLRMRGHLNDFSKQMPVVLNISVFGLGQVS